MRFFIIVVLCTIIIETSTNEHETADKMRKSKKVLSIHSNEAEMLEGLAKKLDFVSEESINQRKVFNIGVSGASLVKQLCSILPKMKNIGAWRFFFNDERLVPFDHVDSTYGLYTKTLREHGVNVNTEQFITVNHTLNASDAALDYIRKMSKHFPNEKIPTLDLLLLGMGPDGHICSLFPGHSLLEESSKPIAAITDSPKPPPNRITMTYPTINNARNVIFVVAGSGKADAVKRIFTDNENLPAAIVNPSKCNVTWFLDSAAAAHLKN